jgi:hypothetical protein
LKVACSGAKQTFRLFGRPAFRVLLISDAPSGGVRPHFCQDCVKLQKFAVLRFGKKAIEFRQIKGLDI